MLCGMCLYMNGFGHIIFRIQILLISYNLLCGCFEMAYGICDTNKVEITHDELDKNGTEKDL